MRAGALPCSGERIGAGEGFEAQVGGLEVVGALGDLALQRVIQEGVVERDGERTGMAVNDVVIASDVQGRIAQIKKEIVGKGYSRYDLYKDGKGNIYVKPKGGSKGPGEPTGININHY